MLDQFLTTGRIANLPNTARLHIGITSPDGAYESLDLVRDSDPLYLVTALAESPEQPAPTCQDIDELHLTANERTRVEAGNSVWWIDSLTGSSHSFADAEKIQCEREAGQ